MRVIDVGCWVIIGGLVNSVDFCYSFSFVLYVVFCVCFDCLSCTAYACWFSCCCLVWCLFAVFGLLRFCGV